ncbi:MAG: hypothetical protein JXR83_11165 [Deltaproteobacteria bacterium]|nr:hypothetical protein [Deltaproteobacteria bacterium]
MSEQTKRVPKIPYLVAAAVLLALPAVSYVVGAFNAPRPMNLTRTRASVNRESMRGSVLLAQVPPQLSEVVPANLENKIEVLGMTVDKPMAPPGGRVELTFYFRALDNIEEDWQIFMHGDGVNNVYRIHGDHYPVDGKYTTDLWQKGEIIADKLVKYIPLDAPVGRYDIWIGFYIGDIRLKLTNADKVQTDGTNRIKVGVVNVGM